jgi:phenylalanyl-tRNA synthetase beta chain
MHISLKWINELVNLESIKLDTLIEKLTLGGFEVEEVIELEKNNQKHIVLDISATANRSDSLSIYGISTEIATLFNQPLKISKFTLKNENWKKIFESKTSLFLESYNCSMLIGVVIENLNSQTVPKWITDKLLFSKIIPSNSLIDFQNYILLETGYPFEFYDKKKIDSKIKDSNFNLSIENSINKHKFLASNGIVYDLDNSILTISANKIPISIAGIIPANEFSISKSTTSLLIEGSIFDAAKIRQQSRKLGLRTDRSSRYEKSLKTTYLNQSLFRLISLLRISNPDLICKIVTIKKTKEKEILPIFLKYKTINEILGPISKFENQNYSYLTPTKINEYLNRLNFKFDFDQSTLTWEIEVPYLRTDDITREIDVIEEIGRLHGFNNFLTTLPKLKTIGIEDFHYKTRKKITSCFLSMGFNEFIHYSLVNDTTYLTNEIEIINPLLSDCSKLRTNLLPSLINTLQENLNQKNLPIEGFEYGHVFSLNPVTKFKEKEHVAGAFRAIKNKFLSTNTEKTLNWFEAKGKIEQLFKQLNLATHWRTYLKGSTIKFFHPYRSAEIFLTNGIFLGTFGQIHPILANKLNLFPDIYLFEFDLEVIKTQVENNNLKFYRHYSLYPKIIKDLSFIVEKDIPFEKIQKTLYLNGTQFLSEINLLDEYRGPSIPDHQTSLCIQLIFQSDTRTLETKEIEAIMTKLQFILKQKYKISIRN